jgi:hypothetical protein
MTDTGLLGVHTPRPFQPASVLSMSPGYPMSNQSGSLFQSVVPRLKSSTELELGRVYHPTK